MNNSEFNLHNSETGRTPQDKLNRHVAFGLHNSKNPETENTLPPKVLPILANWLKNLRHLNTLPLDNKEWLHGLCKSCLELEGPEPQLNTLYLIRATFFKCWPKFSGSVCFPLGGSWKAFQEPTPEYIALRKELSLHCIAELEKLLIPQYSFGNFPLEHRIKILKILKKLYRLPATNDSWETGLCYRISAVEGLSATAEMNYSAQHFKTWKHFSGADHSPIPCGAKINKTKSRKQLRKNLCGHVIKSIEAELKYAL